MSRLFLDEDREGYKVPFADLKSCLLQENCPDHLQSGYGPKGDKPYENFALFEGMRENNLI